MPIIPEGIHLRGASTDPRGRSITAARSFQPGEVIATFGSPSLAIPDSPHLTTTCSGCLTPAISQDIPLLVKRVALRVCTGCKAVAYCSPKCQKLDWNTGGHKAECKLFKLVRSQGHDALPTPVRALVQILLRPEIRAVTGELESHIYMFQRDEGTLWDNMRLQARAALHYLDRDVNMESWAEAVQIFCKLQVNSFSRADEDIEQTGLFLNPALAMVNHSCVPNAFVQFVGRGAVLHASQEIRKDEEIEISYIDHNMHLSHRQEALKTRYHFTCTCPRCKDDLTVYQACQKYPHLHLNNFSLAPYIAKLQDLQNQNLLSRIEPALNATIEEIYPWCSEPLLNLSSSEKQTQLRRRWAATAPLRAHTREAYAIQPLPHILADVGMYFAARGDFAYDLCIACFIAIHVDPYAAPAPFAPLRVKGLFMIAKLLAATTLPGRPRDDTLQGRISAALENIDLATVCQVLLKLVLHYAPAAHSSEWVVLEEVRYMLADIEALPDRETVENLIRVFMQNPDGAVQKRFFNQVVLDPIRELSGFGLEILESELGS